MIKLLVFLKYLNLAMLGFNALLILMNAYFNNVGLAFFGLLPFTLHGLGYMLAEASLQRPEE